VIDTAPRTVVQQIPLPPGSHSLRGLCVSATARGVRVYVTHVLSRYYAPTTQLTRGWMNTAALSVIDATTGALLNTVLLDDLDLGAANPWGVAASADGVWICVAHAGTHEISAIDQGALLEQLQTSGTADTPQDLTFLRDARRRLPLRGAGPRGVAVVGNRAYAAEYFSGTVGVVELAPGNEQGAEEIVVGWRKPMDLRRQGEGNYHDARLCLQQWQSCASCHPDARADGLNWDLLNDGFGNPKNTKGHVASWLTPPVMATGIRKDARTAVRSGLKYIGFVNAPEAQAAAIDEYLRLLPATPSPRLVGGALSAAAVRGQAVFQSVGCAGCHSGPQFTDLQKHDVGTGLGREAGWLFDTPTLIEAWRTAPYLHDGRAPTVREVIVTVQAARVAGLTTEQIDDLVEYVLSL
jgi:mono/diheme cytochrome c family protein